MKCPRTGTDLVEITIDSVKVDFSKACGGVWFDNYELKRFDEVHEYAGQELADLMEEHKSEEIDFEQRLKSPLHPEVTMLRHYYSPKRKIEIDECPQSGGIWLDAGELASIRDLFPTEEERKQAGKAFVADVVAQSGLPALAQKNAERAQKLRRISNLFYWLCPPLFLIDRFDEQK